MAFGELVFHVLRRVELSTLESVSHISLPGSGT